MREIVVFRQPRDVGHAARGPLGGVRGRSFERPRDHVHHRRRRSLSVARPGRGSSANPSRRRTRNRSRHLQTLLLDDVHALGDRAIGETVGAAEHDARPQRQPLRRLRAARPLLQRAAFVVSQQQRLVVTSSSHAAQGTRAAIEVQAFSETRH